MIVAVFLVLLASLLLVALRLVRSDAPLACAVALMVFVPFGAARAQDEDPEARARRLYEVGEAAFAQGEYEVALDLLGSAYELSPRPALLYNMGVCADRLRRDAEAIEHYDGYLARFPDAPNRTDVEARLRALREAGALRSAAAPPESDVLPVPVQVVVVPSIGEGPAQERDVTSEDWFWPVLGGTIAVVIGGVALGVILGTRVGDEPYRTGDIGGVVFALEGAP